SSAIIKHRGTEMMDQRTTWLNLKLFGAAAAAIALCTATLQGQPMITNQPVSLAVAVGSNASFTVSASGTLPFNYQWQFNSTNLSDGGRVTGSQTNVLTIASLATSNAGSYRVIVTNSSGSATSTVAILTVGPPLITSQPSSQVVVVGSEVNLS